MDSNNNNGRGIFYGVIGVATLVVAMIGATFAYFSATVSSGADVIAANSTTITLNLTENTSGIKRNLIPVDETQQGFATGGYLGLAAADTDGDDKNDPKSKNCVDDDGNEFCSIYEFTVINPSATTAQRVYAQMDVKTNTFTSNAKKWCYDATHCYSEQATCVSAAPEGSSCTEGCAYLDGTGEAMYCEKSNFAVAIFKGNASQIDATFEGQDATGDGWNVDGSQIETYYSPDVTSATKNDGSPVTAVVDATSCAGNVAGTAVLGKNGDLVVPRMAINALSGSNTQTIRLNQLDQTLKPGGSVTYTVVMWLHENGQDQDADEAQAFAAGITFNTGLGGTGVTAVLATTGK